MKKREWQKLLDRDGGRCLHCGETEAISPNHRQNRQMGGSKLRDGSSNLVIICSLLNGLIESDHRWARVAQEYGWKLNSWQDPKEEPVFDTLSGTWFQLDDDFNRKLVRPQGRKE